MIGETKRLFFGFSIQSPWPSSFPKGRLIEDSSRHMTSAFLGNIPFDDLKNALFTFPKPSFTIGPVGRSDQAVFLPKKEQRVIAHHVQWLSGGDFIKSFHQSVLGWLEDKGYNVDHRPLMPHITIARAPFEKKEWEEHFQPLPIVISGFHLYESMGNLKYDSLWHLPFLDPFEEFPHTADIGFKIKGTSFTELYVHGATAMSFKFPPFLAYLKSEEIKDIHHVIRALNQMNSSCDHEIGSPFKAVSYHGMLEKKEDDLYHWEMIVDV